MRYDDYGNIIQSSTTDEQINDALGGKSLDDIILDNDAVSPYMKKLVHTTRSAEELQSIVEKKKLEKQTYQDGFKIGYLNRAADSDSGEYTDANGQKRQFRFASMNEYDAIDSQEARLASRYKYRLQPESVARIVGKNVQDLTEADFINVKNYQGEEFKNSLLNKDYKPSDYDPTRLYEAQEEIQQPIAFQYKVIGQDKYGRDLIEAINPNTGRDMVFDTSINPYLNSSFDVYKSINTEANQKRMADFQLKYGDVLPKIADTLDSDGRLGEDIDIIKSTAYQTAARILQYGPDWAVDKKKWERVANAETGQMLADAWAGVKTSTRRDFVNGMSQGLDLWAKGDYLGAIKQYGQQIDRVLSESATQMGLMFGGAAIGTAVAGPIGGALMGGALAATDSTLITNEEYKVNNGGKNMSMKDLVLNWIGNLALLIPETFMAGAHITRFLPKPMRKALTQAYEKGPITTSLKATGGSIVFEGLQEGAQDTLNQYMAQNQNNKKSLMDIATSDEIMQSIVVGGMAGGIMSGAGHAARMGLTRAIKTDGNFREQTKALQEANANQTVTGTEADKDLSARITKMADEINVIPSQDLAATSESSRQAVSMIDSLMAKNPSINVDTQKKLMRKKLDIASASIASMANKADQDAMLKALGVTREELFAQEIMFSDLNAMRRYEQGKRNLTEAGKGMIERQLLDKADRIGLSRTEAKKLLQDVDVEVRHGPRGYLTYGRNMQHLAKLMEDKTLGDEEKESLHNAMLYNLGGIIRLIDNQNTKLNNIVSGTEEMLRNVKNKVYIPYKSDTGDKGFTIHRSNISNQTYEDGTGVYQLVRGLERDISDMNKLLDSAPDGLVDEMFKHSHLPRPTMPELTSAMDRFRTASTKIKESVRNSLEDKGKKYAADTSTNKAIAILNTLTKDNVSDKKADLGIATIRNLSDEQIADIRKKLENRNLVNRTKIASKLDEILKLDKQDKAEIEAVQTREKNESAQTLEDGKKLLDTYTDEHIGKLSSLDDARSLWSQMLGSYDRLKLQNTREADELAGKIQQRMKTLENRGMTLSTQSAMNEENQRKEQRMEEMDAANKAGRAIPSTQPTNAPNLEETTKPEQTPTQDTIVENKANSEPSGGTSTVQPELQPQTQSQTQTSAGKGQRPVRIFMDGKWSEYPSIAAAHKATGIALATIRNTLSGKTKKPKYQIEYGKSQEQGSLLDSRSDSSNRGSETTVTGTATTATESRPAETKPVDNKATESKPADSKPADTKVKQYAKVINDTIAKYPLSMASRPMESMEDSSAYQDALDAMIAVGKRIRESANLTGEDVINGVNETAKELNRLAKHIQAFMDAKKGKTTESSSVENRQSDSTTTSKPDNHVEAQDDALFLANQAMDTFRKEDKKKAFDTVYQAGIDLLEQSRKIATELNTTITKKLTEEQDEYQEQQRKKREAKAAKEAAENGETELKEAELSTDDTLLTTENEAANKDYAINTIFDGDGTTLSNTGVEFDLHNEILIGDNPACTIAVDGKYDESLTRDILDFCNSNLKLRLFKGMGIRKANGVVETVNGNPFNYFAGTPTNKRSILTSAPHLRLLYKMSVQYGNLKDGGKFPKGVQFQFRPEVLSIIDFSAREFFSQSNLVDLFNPSTMYDLASMYGQQEELMDNSGTNILKSVNKDTGVPRSVVASRLGELIVKNMGIRANNETGTYGFMEELAGGLGLFAVDYLTAKGFFEEGYFDREAWIREHPDTECPLSFSFTTIKLTNKKPTGYIDSFTQPETGLQARYKAQDTRAASIPRVSEERLPKDIAMRHTNRRAKVPEYARGVMQKLWNTNYVINTEAVDLLMKNLPGVLRHLEYFTNSDMASLTADENISAEGTNRGTTRELANLIAYSMYYKKNPTRKLFFNWFMSRNGRLFIDSNTINPQTSKQIQRFLILPEKIRRRFNYNNAEDRACEYFAIAQAFDFVETDKAITGLGETFNKLSLEQIREMTTDFINMSPKKFSYKWSEILNNLKDKRKYKNIDFKLGEENFCQCINVLQHLEKRKANNDAEFDTWLAIENDSTTSGYFIRFMQFPNESIGRKYFEKVGIIPANTSDEQTTIHQMKKERKGFLDIYKTLASGATGHLIRMFRDSDKMNPDRWSFLSTVKKNDSDEVRKKKQAKDRKLQQALADTFNLMYVALPKAEVLPDGTYKITSELRKLMKPAAMVYGYTAGQRSISAKLASEIEKEFVHTYMQIANAGGLDAYIAKENEDLAEIGKKLDDKEIAKLKNIVATMDRIGGWLKQNTRGETDLVKALRKKSTADILFKVEDKYFTMDRFFETLLAPTYGQAVWDTLQEDFQAYEKYNEQLNLIAVTMFRLFEREFDNRIRQAMIANGNMPISIKEYKRITDELREYMPIIPLSYSDSLEEGCMLMGTKKIRDRRYEVTHLSVNARGELTQDTMYPNVYQYDNAGKGGAVLPIHFIDGQGMARTLDKYPDNIPVHDAIVMSAMDGIKIPRDYNGFMFALCKDYDLFDKFTSRLLEVTDKFDETVLAQMEVRNGLGQIIWADREEGIPLTVKDLMKDAQYYNASNQEDRAGFFSQQWLITNMDGRPGSAYVAGPETDVNEILARDVIQNSLDEIPETLHSQAQGYNTNGEVRQLLQDANSSMEGRINLIDKLQDLSSMLGNRKASKEMVEHYKDIFKRINPEHIKDMIVSYSTNRDFASGMLEGANVVIGFDNHTANVLDRYTRLHPFSDKSGAEIYAHEVVHKAVSAAMKIVKDIPIKNQEMKAALNRVLELQRIAAQKMTWQDFMPETYDKACESTYEQAAKDCYEYVFNNKDPHVGLQEFIAYAMTHEGMMNKLKEIKVVEKNNQNLSLLDKIVRFGKLLLDVVFGRESFGNAFNLANEIMKGNLPLRYKSTVYAEMDRLYSSMVSANNEAALKLFHIRLRPVEQAFSVISMLRDKGNNIISPWLQKAFNFLDLRGNPFVFNVSFTGSKYSKWKMIGNAVIGMMFSETRRKAFVNQILPHLLQQSQTGAVMSIVRDLSTPDMQTNRLEALTAIQKMIERASKTIESTTYAELSDKLGEINDIQDKALTTSCLNTDIQCLYKQGMPYIKKLLTDEKFLNDEIDNAANELKKNQHGIYYINQCRALGHFMMTGIGNEALNLNATNIANMYLTGKNVQATQDTIDLIDKLTTLYALSENKADNLIAGNLDEEGLDTFIRTAQDFVKKTRDGVEVTTEKNGKPQTSIIQTVDNMHMIKGYTKQLLDSSYEVKIDFTSNRKQLAHAGYIEVRELPANNVTGGGFSVYRRSFINPQRRDGNAFTLTGQHTVGTTLTDTAFSIVHQTDDRTDPAAMATLSKFRHKAEQNRKQIVSRMEARLLTEDDFNRMSSGYIPVISPKTGMPVDYRITMTQEHKINDLHMNMSGRTVLSKMLASQYTKANAQTRNRTIARWLLDDMHNNMDRVSHRSNKDPSISYVLLDKNSPNKYIRDSWGVIPKEIKDLAYTGHFYVREDWLNSLFGVKSLSITDLKIVDKMPMFIKRGLSIAEYIMKTISYMAKQNIILRVPEVLISNVVSNLMVSVANGTNLATVVRMTINNTKALRDYMDTEKALNRIKFRERIGTATQQEIASKGWYQAKLENNIIYPLVKKGMYQAIAEDLRSDEMDSIGAVQKFIKNNKIADKIPNSIKSVMKQLYMAEGTLPYEFMRQATQYSDFVARATEYQLRMAKAPKQYIMGVNAKGQKVRTLNPEYIRREEEITAHVWNTFINYDKPQSAFLQYMNDLGLMMFTKFAMRIQSVIKSGVMKNPIGVLMFLFGQSMFTDVEDIYEQNVFNKNWGALLHSPWDNLTNALTPVPLQYAFGMR